MGYSVYKAHLGDCGKCQRGRCVLTGKDKEGMYGVSGEQTPLLPPDILGDKEPPARLLTRENAEADEEEERKKREGPIINEQEWNARGLLMPPEVREAMHRQRRQGKSKTKQGPVEHGPAGGTLLPIELHQRRR